jgi:hypothetical protein
LPCYGIVNSCRRASHQVLGSQDKKDENVFHVVVCWK